MTEIYDDHGIRFEYPGDWEIEVTDDGPLTTVAVQAPSGLAFALVTVDDDCPAPAEVADQALEALREEYPVLDAAPALESINGHRAVGQPGLQRDQQRRQGDRVLPAGLRRAAHHR